MFIFLIEEIARVGAAVKPAYNEMVILHCIEKSFNACSFLTSWTRYGLN